MVLINPQPNFINNVWVVPERISAEVREADELFSRHEDRILPGPRSVSCWQVLGSSPAELLSDEIERLAPKSNYRGGANDL